MARLDDDDDRLDRFELTMAIMLGLGAVGGAWAGFQSDLWGGKQAEEYSLASKEMARAASVMSEASAQMGAAAANVTAAMSTVSQILSVHSHNINIDLQAKQHLVEGAIAFARARAEQGVAEDAKIQPPVEAAKHFYVAKYLYAVHLDAEYYSAMGFPAEYRGHYKFAAMPDEVLIAKGNGEIPAAVVDKLLAGARASIGVAATAYQQVVDKQTQAGKSQLEADAHFQVGGKAGTVGDNLGVTGVLYTVALFLAGIGLVFKTRVRWGFAVIGLVALVGATLHLFLQEWSALP
jgi:hypothetical protein